MELLLKTSYYYLRCHNTIKSLCPLGSTNAPQVELSATKVTSTARTFDPRISVQDLSRTGLAFTMPPYDALVDAVRQKNLDRVTALLDAV